MSYVREMIDTHPQTVSSPKKETLVNAVQACFDCAQACVTCSDACLGEKNVEQLKSVIRSTADSADLCIAAGRILSRLNNPKWEVIRNVANACMTQVRDCGMECNEHARHHEHCRICADSCRKCETALSEYMKHIQ